MRPDPTGGPYTGNQTIFLSGPPGSGKTTLAIQRLSGLLEQGIPAEQVLVLIPQRTLARPYYDALQSGTWPGGGQVDVATVGGLARRTIDLFWPLVSGPAGFAQPALRPHFLTLETAQYHMERNIAPFVASGAFDGITISPARLVSQVIDNLNKAAAVGFPVTDIGARLKAAWEGESARLQIYDQVQAVALAFRDACLAQNLLDWSLQIEIFWHHLLPRPEVRRYLLSGYRHLIVDNIEEDIPVSHDLLRLWLPQSETALLLYDTDGGYRVFLGADPQGALDLASLCRTQIVLTASHITTPALDALAAALTRRSTSPPSAGQRTQVPGTRSLIGEVPAGPVARPWPDLHQVLFLPAEPPRFHVQMLDWVADQVAHLVHAEHLAPGEIAILAPFLSGALRFVLTERLARLAIPVRSHRPSRQLREEPAVRALLTLARLAHPAWKRPPPAADVASALTLSIADLDPVRASLLVDIVYRVRNGHGVLTPFHQIIPETQQRISYLLGGRYDELRQWLERHTAQPESSERSEELDHFLGRLFGELLSQPGFGFHRDLDAGALAANLIESVFKFRRGLGDPDTGQLHSGSDLGHEYVDLVESGVLAAQYVSSWELRSENAVLLVPAYTFLMMNRPATVQFWLDGGSSAWFERIYQPLTHPHVLRRDWPEGKKWSDEDEIRVREEMLTRLILGLCRRCRQRIYLAYSELNEQGYEQQGPLLQAVERIVRRREGRPS